jgi:hypothetical protein
MMPKIKVDPENIKKGEARCPDCSMKKATEIQTKRSLHNGSGLALSVQLCDSSVTEKTKKKGGETLNVKAAEAERTWRL